MKTCRDLVNSFLKLKGRNKRGLVNALGYVIKLIAGNPDSDDLNEINSNLQNLFNNQSKIIQKINKFTSFANHLTDRYYQDQKEIFLSLNQTASIVNKLNQNIDIRTLIELDINLGKDLLSTLHMLERTISLAFNDITNLEIITYDELRSIFVHLSEMYEPNELLIIDDLHPFRITEFSKFHVVLINEQVVFMLKIPILAPFSYNYTKIYPIPNDQNIVLIPPARFNLYRNGEEAWTEEECSTISSQIICKKTPQRASCSLQDIVKCQQARVLENFKLYKQLSNNEVLVSSNVNLEIIENCKNRLNRIKINGNNVIESTCNVIIENEVFEKTNLNFTIKIPNITLHTLQPSKLAIQLKLNHLKDFDKLRKEINILQNENQLSPVIHFVHQSVTIFICIIIIIIIVLVIKFRSKIINLFKPKTTISISTMKQLLEQDRLYPDLRNEDVSS